MKKRRDKPLSVRVTRDGVLTIEIGIETNAHACLASSYAWRLTDPKRTGRERDPRTVFEITDARGFARDIVGELTEEAEDGSSLLTNMLDAAFEKAIENGSEHFDRVDGEP